ncbi:endonuclease domain-containing protein [Dokdonia ponticola]|uniref:Endonuclease domain-containing protein n=1 Tax=Dokdonia ponticola TaxID=2041041 RepID=A0ABV9I0S0_9FLAO
MKSKKPKLHDPEYTKGFRKSLRNGLTSAEAFLWNHLKERKLAGRKFRRQHGVGKFIVDFYCASEKLVIELDGQTHMNPTAQVKDEERTQFLASKGLTVIRFENKMVFNLLPSVLKDIEDHFMENRENRE